VFSHGIIFNKFFKLAKDSDDFFKVGYKNYKFEMVPDYSTSEAVKSLPKALSFIDCGLACHLAARTYPKNRFSQKKIRLKLRNPFQ
jgi:hypothetical protein